MYIIGYIHYPLSSFILDILHLRMLFYSFFKTLVGKEVAVELKNDIVLMGTLVSVDQYLNIKLSNVSIVNADKYPQLVSYDYLFIYIYIRHHHYHYLFMLCLCNINVGIHEKLFYSRLRRKVKLYNIYINIQVKT